MKDVSPFWIDATGVFNPGTATTFSVLLIESCYGEFYSEISCSEFYSDSDRSFLDISSD